MLQQRWNVPCTTESGSTHFYLYIFLDLNFFWKKYLLISSVVLAFLLTQVGKMTLGGLLALGYSVVVSYKRASNCVIIGNISLSYETIDNLSETFMVLRGTNRKVWFSYPKACLKPLNAEVLCLHLFLFDASVSCHALPFLCFLFSWKCSLAAVSGVYLLCWSISTFFFFEISSQYQHCYTSGHNGI